MGLSSENETSAFLIVVATLMQNINVKSRGRVLRFTSVGWVFGVFLKPVSEYESFIINVERRFS